VRCGVTHAEIDGKPVFCVEGACVVYAPEFFFAEDVGLLMRGWKRGELPRTVVPAASRWIRYEALKERGL
jgi:hypothetical protein